MCCTVSGSEDEFRFPGDSFEFDDDDDEQDGTELERALDRAAEALEENEQYVDDFREVTEAIAEGRIGAENVVEELEASNDEHRINFARYINATNYFLHQTEEEINDMQGTLSNIESTVEELSQLDIPDNLATVDDIPDDYAREDTLNDLFDEINDIDGGTKNYILDLDIKDSLEYIGGGIKNFFSWGSDKTEEIEINNKRRKFLGVVAGAALVDYSNVLPGDKNAGDGYLRIGDCGGDIDLLGGGNQERCAPQDNGNGDGTPPGDDGASDPVDDVQTPYERDVELSDEDLQYAIDNTGGTDQELSNIKNIDGNLNDFGYDPNSDEFYVEVEDGDEETRVEISEEAYWNAVDN